MRTLFILCLVFLMSCSQQEIQRTLDTVNESIGGSQNQLSSSEVAAGLKEALEVGTRHAVSVSSVKDGFYKNPKLFIPFPEEAAKVKEAALKVGLDSQVNQFEQTLNRAAEEAVKQATPIFIDAITSMTIEDAFGILRGGNNSATMYLRNKTGDQLRALFEPKVADAVNKVELTKYYSPLAKVYNTSAALTGGEPVDPDLTAYVTNEAIDGLFVLIAEEEKDIRENPAARVSDLLRKVFGAQ